MSYKTKRSIVLIFTESRYFGVYCKRYMRLTVMNYSLSTN